MTFTVRTVRELKGCPLSCYVLIRMAGEPVNNEWLCRFSGYTDKPVSQAVKLLGRPEYQLIRRARGGWLPVDDPQLILGETGETLKSRKISDPTTTNILINTGESIDSVVVVGRKKSDSEFDACFEACQQNGIFDPSASQISELEHVTPELIAAHVADLQPGERRGLAIVRLKNNELPASWLPTASQPQTGMASAFDEYLNG